MSSLTLPRAYVSLGPGLVLALGAASCGGGASGARTSPPPVAVASASAGPSEPADEAIPTTGSAASAAAPAATGIPTACRPDEFGFCMPPPAFVERLCARPRQDTALALFAQSPFTRAYVRGRVDELLGDEEVIVLRFHAPSKNGMIVGSGKGTFDLLRWDGTCSTAIEAEVITRSRPPRPRTARVQWHRIATRTQDALVAGSEAVRHAHARRGKECKGAMSGDVSAACEKADGALVGAVVEYVRAGGSLPPPDDVP